jgi:hypothetical protein
MQSGKRWDQAGECEGEVDVDVGVDIGVDYSTVAMTQRAPISKTLSSRGAAGANAAPAPARWPGSCRRHSFSRLSLLPLVLLPSTPPHGELGRTSRAPGLVNTATTTTITTQGRRSRIKSHQDAETSWPAWQSVPTTFFATRSTLPSSRARARATYSKYPGPLDLIPHRMGIINEVVKNIAPILYLFPSHPRVDPNPLTLPSIATSPITSYGDQIYSMHRTRSSAGFSLDIPLIMLVASILKVFYWFGSHFSTSLLVQAILMIGVHLLCLHVALTNRPPMSHLPFQIHNNAWKRPWDFWQWRNLRPYWTFLTYFTLGLLVAHLLIGSTRLFTPYTEILGAIALTIEATLPLPQLYANWSRKGCRGFRPSVIVNWVIGDTFKMWFFFASSSGEVPWAFKVCGIFQATCDLGLALQYLVWGDGPEGVDGTSREKEVRSPPPEEDAFSAEKLSGVAAIEMQEGSVWERPRAA